MASNFPHMSGANQMMQQQQQQMHQQQQQQQLQQGRPAMTPMQMQAIVCQKLQESTPSSIQGWKTTLSMQERLTAVFNLIGQLRLLNPNNVHKIISLALGFEREIFESASDKTHYQRELATKQAQLHETRNRAQAGMQQQIAVQAQAQAQQQMMNQNGMQGQIPRGMPQQPPQQGFQHLQRQMQASPLPPSQPQLAPGSVPNDALSQNMTPNQNFQQNGMPQQPQAGPGRTMNGQQPPMDTQMLQKEAAKLFNEASEEEKNNMRAIMQTKDPMTFSRVTAQGGDPALLGYRHQVFLKHRAQQMAQGQQSALSQQPQNGVAAAPAMQQQRSMNPSPMNGPPQPPTSMGGTDMSFMGNMENLIGQQQAGVMAQEAGQMVVPVSGPRNGTPQPNVVMPGQSMNINEQRPGGIPNPRTQAQQAQVFNAQQNHRMQQAAAQQQQSQARANAAVKAQQMGLQGQPGGMGPGPMPPHQSPAMNTLNTPLRTPSQQMNHAEGMRMNPNPQFGQPLDARFMQANQRQMGPGNGINPAMLNGMPPEQQQRLLSLPPERLNEVVQKWHAAQNARMQAQQMSIPGGNMPGRPGPQASQFTPQQNALSQFIMANPGQRPPPSMMAGMTPQQQFLLQQQMAMHGQNSMQRRPENGPDQRQLMMQMDNMEFPPNLLNAPQLPRGIPAEVKKWNQLKQWISTNPNVPPEAMESVKTMQKAHYIDLMRRRQAAGQQAPQPIGLPPGASTGQNPMSVVPPGMAAPVAPMGQAPMQMPNGMNMALRGVRQPTPQEIQNVRNHPSGKFADASDDMLRQFIVRQQTMLQMQQQRQAQMASQQMAQMNGQQARPNPPNGPTNGNPMAAAQQPPVQAPQQKPPTSEPATSTPTPAPANRPRPQQNNKAQAAQKSSPAQPPKNLKRASSDDVVEVPNPNTQQRSIPPPPQQNQAAGRTLTPEQLAKLTPEQRKQYEAFRQQHARHHQNVTTFANKLKELAQEENERAKGTLSDIPMDQQTKLAMTSSLREIVTNLLNLTRALPKWYAVTQDENRARIFFRTRHRLCHQFKDSSFREVKDAFSIKPAEVDHARSILQEMIKDLSDKYPAMKKDATQSSSTNQPSVPASQAPEAVPLNAANLQQQQQQLNKMHQRSNSRSSHPPAAPTSSQPPFPFGASSPHGQPIYNTVKPPAVTQENLHLPARKKQKPNNAPAQGQGTPGSTSSPLVSKTTSPEVKRQQLTESSAPVRTNPALCCSELDCERHTVGFETMEELRHHANEEHVKPLANPQKYAEENLASLLGLDPQGNPKKAATAPVVNSATPSNGTKMAAGGSKQGQTPKVDALTPSASASTPMIRQASMNRQGSSTGSKSAQAKGKSQSDNSNDMSKPEKDNNQPSVQPAQVVIPDPWANATIDPHDLYQTFSGFESGADGAISDMNVYRSITPNDTPESSKDGVPSEPTSDISEGMNLDIEVDIFDDQWMPFGPSDTDALLDGNMGNYNVNLGEDLTMFDSETFVPQQAWDDMGDQSMFDKPFKFDSSLYSMDL